jgi:ribosomal protein L12E/L44/L45/RPP1/RPP2
MSGDIFFEDKIQRTISVDIRYVLFVVEKLMGGKNIVDELKYVKKKPAAVPAPVAPEAPIAPAAEPLKKETKEVKKEAAKPTLQPAKKK